MSAGILPYHHDLKLTCGQRNRDDLIRCYAMLPADVDESWVINLWHKLEECEEGPGGVERTVPWRLGREVTGFYHEGRSGCASAEDDVNLPIGFS